MRRTTQSSRVATWAALASLASSVLTPAFAGDGHSGHAHGGDYSGTGGHDDAGRRGGGGVSHVDQVEANTSKVLQYGEGNSVSVHQRAVPVAGGAGGGHAGHVSGAIANSVIAGQAGEMNAINATQEGAANALIVGQYGSDNGVTAQQRGANNTAAVGQAGANLNANIDQSGNGLSVGILQIGAGDGRAVSVRQR